MMFSTKGGRIVSADLVAALLAIGITIWAWFSSSHWPAWPAFGAMAIVFGSHNSFAGLRYGVRAAATIFLIAVNVGAWAVVLRSLGWLWQVLESRSTPNARR